MADPTTVTRDDVKASFGRRPAGATAGAAGPHWTHRLPESVQKNRIVRRIQTGMPFPVVLGVFLVIAMWGVILPALVLMHPLPPVSMNHWFWLLVVFAIVLVPLIIWVARSDKANAAKTEEERQAIRKRRFHVLCVWIGIAVATMALAALPFTRDWISLYAWIALLCIVGGAMMWHRHKRGTAVLLAVLAFLSVAIWRAPDAANAADPRSHAEKHSCAAVDIDNTAKDCQEVLKMARDIVKGAVVQRTEDPCKLIEKIAGKPELKQAVGEDPAFQQCQVNLHGASKGNVHLDSNADVAKKLAQWLDEVGKSIK